MSESDPLVSLQESRDGIRIVEETPDDAGNLAAYGSVSIAFSVETRFVVRTIDQGLGGLRLVEEPVRVPCIKDYDALEGEGPTRWRESFDLSHWGMFAAYDGGRRVGGAVIAWKTPGLDMLEGREDWAALWDLRVDPRYRGQKVGHRLFQMACHWAKRRGCRELRIETQNINVPACRFYARQACTLRTIRQNAYPDLPDEIQLIWSRRI